MSGRSFIGWRQRLVGLAMVTVAVVALAACEYGEADGVSRVTDISARLHGKVHSKDPLPEYWFEYDDAPKLVEGAGLVFDSSTQHGEWACCGPMETATFDVQNLTPDTTYQYRLCIRTESGGGLCGAARSFRTKPDDRDVVSGSAYTPPLLPFAYGIGIDLDVRADPDSSDPVGRVSVSLGGRDIRFGDATCLRIVGNRVAVGFVSDEILEGVPGVPQVVFVEDNGATGDRWATVTVASAPLDCPDPSTASVSWYSPTNGNITVTDH